MGVSPQQCSGPRGGTVVTASFWPCVRLSVGSNEVRVTRFARGLVVWLYCTHSDSGSTRTCTFNGRGRCLTMWPPPPASVSASVATAVLAVTISPHHSPTRTVPRDIQILLASYFEVRCDTSTPPGRTLGWGRHAQDTRVHRPRHATARHFRASSDAVTEAATDVRCHGVGHSHAETA
jgi:hypothetical protein